MRVQWYGTPERTCGSLLMQQQMSEPIQHALDPYDPERLDKAA